MAVRAALHANLQSWALMCMVNCGAMAGVSTRQMEEEDILDEAWRFQNVLMRSRHGRIYQLSQVGCLFGVWYHRNPWKGAATD